MKLYFSTGACSLAPHIVLREAAYTFDLERVDLTNKRTERDEDFTQINPKGYVPALQLDSGEILTEAVVILQYLADQKPDSRLAPTLGTLERYRLMEWLHFISTEIHKQFSPLFNPNIISDWRDYQIALLSRRFDYLNTQINGKPYLMDEHFTIADAYLFTVLNWANLLKIDLSKWPVLTNYLNLVANRSAVREAMRAEKLRV